MPALCARAITGKKRAKTATIYLALDFILHLLVRKVDDATLLSQRKMVFAGKKWNSRAVHKKVRCGKNLTVCQRRATNAARVCSLAAIHEERDEIGEAIEINIRGVRGSVVRAEAIIHGGSERSSIASGLHIHFGVTDQDGSRRSGTEFAKNGLRSKRIGLFRSKAVPAVDGAEIFRQAEALQDAHAHAHR